MESGSSPHTRGAPLLRAPRRDRRRIIPAYAGSTPGSGPSTAAWTDHPRIRGEHVGRFLRVGVDLGSSPHTRGAPARSRPWRRRGWIIPAYAGSTSLPMPPWAWPTDHPRIRGEHDSVPLSTHFFLWIIPAYAGSTARRQAFRSAVSDHPRIRGEHWTPSLDQPLSLGSSPHTRGAPHRRRRRRRWSGIIPAYAGSTAPTRRVSMPGPDHPRIRGEHLLTTPSSPWNTGSSPHTRGAPPHGGEDDDPGGIIPAYAGSTGTKRKK